MPRILSKIVRKMPPFRHIYDLTDEFEKKIEELLRKQTEAEKKYTALQKNFQEYQKNAEEKQKKLKEEISVLSQKEQKDIEQLKAKQQKDVEQLKTKQQKDVEQLKVKEQKDVENLKNQDQKNFKKLDDRQLTARKELSKDISYYYFKGLHPDQYAENLKDMFYLRLGEELDLEHPKTYNEKIQWLKLYDSTPLKAQLSDKIAVRDWVKEKIGEKYLVPLLGVYDRFDDIDFDSLPDRFVIKTNHASTANRVVTDKSTLNMEETKRFFGKWMRRNYAFWNNLELHYKPIKPKLLVEEYIDNNGKDIDDYKILCFNGKAYYTLFYTDRKNGTKMAIFDREWNRMPFTHSYPQYEGEVEKPDNLEEMLSLAEILSEGFYHVRVDFYRLGDGSLKFGEMTFTMASGTSPWQPKEYDRILGDLMKLPTDEEQSNQ